MKVIKQSIPSVEGWYFIKHPNYPYWQCLVMLRGKAPFLKIINTLPLFFENQTSIALGDLNNLDWSELIELTDINSTVYGDNQLIETMRSGNRLQAIKDHKELTGKGLKEAKEYCDVLYEKYVKPYKD